MHVPQRVSIDAIPQMRDTARGIDRNLMNAPAVPTI
jgi:hypothetical protein